LGWSGPAALSRLLIEHDVRVSRIGVRESFNRSAASAAGEEKRRKKDRYFSMQTHGAISSGKRSDFTVIFVVTHYGRSLSEVRAMDCHCALQQGAAQILCSTMTGDV
jgi:hypothetical protein